MVKWQSNYSSTLKDIKCKKWYLQDGHNLAIFLKWSPKKKLTQYQQVLDNKTKLIPQKVQKGQLKSNLLSSFKKENFCMLVAFQWKDYDSMI